MQRFTSSVRQALNDKNWYAALYLSLTMPDICARLESDNSRTSPQQFIDWFDEYLADRYRAVIVGESHIFLSGNDCYALRCAMLHEGGSDISSQKRKDALEKFHFTAVGAHCNHFGSVLQLDVPTFCNDVCKAVDRWFEVFQVAHADIQSRIESLVKIHVGAHEMGSGVFFQGTSGT